MSVTAVTKSAVSNAVSVQSLRILRLTRKGPTREARGHERTGLVHWLRRGASRNAGRVIGCL
jgi:hypothetical protein